MWQHERHHTCTRDIIYRSGCVRELVALAVVSLAACGADYGNDLVKVARLYNRQQTRSRCFDEPRACEVLRSQRLLSEDHRHAVVADECANPRPCRKCDRSASSYRGGCSRASAACASTSVKCQASAQHADTTQHDITPPNFVLSHCEPVTQTQCLCSAHVQAAFSFLACTAVCRCQHPQTERRTHTNIFLLGLSGCGTGIRSGGCLLHGSEQLRSLLMHVVCSSAGCSRLSCHIHPVRTTISQARTGSSICCTRAMTLCLPCAMAR